MGNFFVLNGQIGAKQGKLVAFHDKKRPIIIAFYSRPGQKDNNSVISGKCLTDQGQLELILINPFVSLVHFRIVHSSLLQKKIHNVFGNVLHF